MLSDTNKNSDQYESFDDITIETINGRSFPHKKLGNIKVPLDYTLKGYNLMKNLEIHDGDIYVCTFPRSGSHWLLYIITLITWGEEPTKDTLKECYFVAGATYNDEDVKQAKSPRLFWSHFPYQYSPFNQQNLDKLKCIYLARNPKETVVSLYSLWKTASNGERYNPGTWNEFLERFMEGKNMFGHWNDHVSGWWHHRHDSNVMFLWYEDLKKDFDNTVIRIAKFLGYSLTTMQLSVIKEKTSFNNMKATKDGKIVSFTSNEAYFRSGSNETWKDYFTQEQALKFDQLVPFPYDYKEK
uniref:Sulfotransferase domain-containing protein n=1 Tax=Acrobeloides nanus TaxID=290746 RepID=A0A914DZ33_9BILA